MSPLEWSEDLVSAYVDDELAPEARAEVEAQLAASAERQAVLEEVWAARDAVRSLPAVDLTPEAWRAVRAVVAADEPPPVTAPGRVAALRSRVRARPAGWAGLGAAVAAAAVVVAVVFVPGPARIAPKVATFATEHSTRASVGSDPVSALAGASIMRGLGR